eukprot:409816_1
MALQPHAGGGASNTNTYLTAEELENNIGGLPVTNVQLESLFSQYDVNNNGFLEFDEMRAIVLAFDNYGVEMSDSELNTLINKYHVKKDGRVTFDEFACIILNICQR